MTADVEATTRTLRQDKTKKYHRQRQITVECGDKGWRGGGRSAVRNSPPTSGKLNINPSGSELAREFLARAKRGNFTFLADLFPKILVLSFSFSFSFTVENYAYTIILRSRLSYRESSFCSVVPRRQKFALFIKKRVFWDE